MKSELYFFVLCVLGFVHAYTESIPSPNVCTHDDTNTGVTFRSWLSNDCPRSALCVPTKHNHTELYCSCVFSEEVFKQKGSKCKPTASSYVIAVCWALLSLSCMFLVVGMFRQLRYNFKIGQFRCDMLTVACVSSWFGSIMMAVHTLLYLIILCSNDLSSDTYVLVTNIRTGLVALHSLFVLVTVMIFGVAVHYIAVCSTRLRGLNLQRLKRRVACIAISTSTSMLIVVLPLLYYAQYGLSSAAFAFFALMAWWLYGRVLSSMSAVEDNGPSEFSNSGGRGSMKSGESRAVSLLLEIHQLSRQLTILMFLFALVSGLLNLFWFMGRERIDRHLLGDAVAATNIAIYIIVVIGFGFVLRFSHRLAIVRSRASSTTGSFSHRLRNSIENSAAMKHTNIATPGERHTQPSVSPTPPQKAAKFPQLTKVSSSHNNPSSARSPRSDQALVQMSARATLVDN